MNACVPVVAEAEVELEVDVDGTPRAVVPVKSSVVGVVGLLCARLVARLICMEHGAWITGSAHTHAHTHTRARVIH